MKEKPLSIKLITFLGIAVAGYRFYDGIVFNKVLFLFDGIAIFLLSIGLFRLLNLARFATIVFSLYFIALYIFLFIMCARNNFHYGWGIALVANFPALIWSIFALIIPHLPTNRRRFS